MRGTGTATGAWGGARDCGRGRGHGRGQGRENDRRMGKEKNRGPKTGAGAGTIYPVQNPNIKNIPEAKINSGRAVNRQPGYHPEDS